jgi:hypothetical protein
MMIGRENQIKFPEKPVAVSFCPCHPYLTRISAVRSFAAFIYLPTD